MLKSIGFGDLVRLFSSSRHSDRVYLGRFVWDLVRGLIKMQASRRVVDSLGVRFYCFLLALSLKSTSLSARIHMWVQVVQYDWFSSGVFLPHFSLPPIALGSVYVGEGLRYSFLGAESHFWVLCSFLVNCFG